MRKHAPDAVGFPLVAVHTGELTAEPLNAAGQGLSQVIKIRSLFHGDATRHVKRAPQTGAATQRGRKTSYDRHARHIAGSSRSSGRDVGT